MKRFFTSRKPPRAVARVARRPDASEQGKFSYEAIAMCIAIWLGILVAGQLLARLPDLPPPQSGIATTPLAVPTY